jgi:hypothetical protein
MKAIFYNLLIRLHRFLLISQVHYLNLQDGPSPRVRQQVLGNVARMLKQPFDSVALSPTARMKSRTSFVFTPASGASTQHYPSEFPFANQAGSGVSLTEGDLTPGSFNTLRVHGPTPRKDAPELPSLTQTLTSEWQSPLSLHQEQHHGTHRLDVGTDDRA